MAHFISDKVEAASSLSETMTLQQLLDYNQQRLQIFLKCSLFTLIQDGTLADAKKRQIFLDSLQIWTEGNQILLLSRQATCCDPNFQTIFLKHFQEEIGHDELYNDRTNKSTVKDAIMTAITTWFVHQMFVLDNIEKATIIHLVIESASDVYHKITQPNLAPYIKDAYFKAHDVDAQHIAMGVQLLSGYSSKVYQRLYTIIEDAWDMLTAMVDRVFYLVNNVR